MGCNNYENDLQKAMRETPYVMVTRELFNKMTEQIQFYKEKEASEISKIHYTSVLWNNEMDYCIGLKTELDQDDFIYEAKKAHKELTGEILDDDDFDVLNFHAEDIWRLIVHI